MLLATPDASVIPAPEPVLFRVNVFIIESVIAALNFMVGAPPLVPAIVKLDVDEPFKLPAKLMSLFKVKVFPLMLKKPAASLIDKVLFTLTSASNCFCTSI
ncbi:MAG: hypothetical protein V9E96_21115 [Chitinophagaceae bacterium]